MPTELMIIAGQALLKYGPEVARGLVAIFTKENPTLEDWDNHVFSKPMKPYAQYTGTQLGPACVGANCANP